MLHRGGECLPEQSHRRLYLGKLSPVDGDPRLAKKYFVSLDTGEVLQPYLFVNMNEEGGLIRRKRPYCSFQKPRTLVGQCQVCNVHFIAAKLLFAAVSKEFLDYHG